MNLDMIIKKKEFYFYELDEFYNKYDNVKLTHDYMVISDNEKVSYRKYGSDTIEKSRTSK